MSVITRWTVYTIFYVSTVVVIYVLLSMALLYLSSMMLSRQAVFLNPMLRTYQELHYYSTIRHFVDDPECAVFDHDLIYKPKIGRCEFRTPFFRTTLNFDENGRVTGAKPDGPGIAVLGDSYAMGWGVEDGETFAAILEKMIHRPVYNLGVSAYSTYRELLRLENSGLLPKVNTIVIQYCINDLYENVDGHFGSTLASPRALFDSWYAEVPLYRVVQATLMRPVLTAKRGFETGYGSERAPIYEDFSPHYRAMSGVLSKFPWLRQKHVIVFYAQSPYVRFNNFEEVGNHGSSGSPIFFDTSVGPGSHYLLDGHLNKLGHQRTAEKLFPFVSQSPIGEKESAKVR